MTIFVPALYNLLPAECLAAGWLNEIDALQIIRQRMVQAAEITGWDVFTFHTLHNLDRYFDSTIGAVRETWVSEGSLSLAVVNETKARFGQSCDYYRPEPRLIENLVFQSALLEWLEKRSDDVKLTPHVVGTSLLSALVSSRAMTFESAVRLGSTIGKEWDLGLQWVAEQQALKASPRSRRATDIGWLRFNEVRTLIEGRSALSLSVSAELLPSRKDINAPARSFWYSADRNSEPMLIETAKHAAAALETLNIASWSANIPKRTSETARGLLVSPLHPAARKSRWSVSTFPLATPSAAILFLDHIAVFGRPVLHAPEPEKGFQKRFRLSRIKVTGP